MIRTLFKRFSQPIILKSIEQGFEMPLRAGYADEQDFLAAFIFHADDDHSKILGGVVMLNTPFGVPLLSKIWVHPDYRGQGLARALWNHAEKCFPQFFWRSLADNPVVPFYKRKATGGFIQYGHRYVYFKGLWPQHEAGSPLPAVTWAYELPFDFIREELQAA